MKGALFRTLAARASPLNMGAKGCVPWSWRLEECRRRGEMKIYSRVW